MLQARETALKILAEIEKNQAYLNISFQEKMHDSSLSARDIAFVKELVYGVTKRKITLDYAASRYSSVKLKKLSVYILSILRMGLYQMFYMDKIPQSAAVNESVKLAGKYGHGASRGYVNALLRKLAKEGLPEPTETESISALSVRYSHPEELVAWYVKTFGEKAQELLKQNNVMPPLCVRINSLRTTAEQLKTKLAEEGIEARSGSLTHSALLLTNGSPQRLSAYAEGLFTVQDQSAQLAALALSPKPGNRVLDACAAPGGKTTHMAEMMENQGDITALDIYEKRLRSVTQTAQRLGVLIITTCACDAATYKAEKPFDKILVDAPCSGLGVIRRRPDIKYKENLTDFAGLVTTQKAILENCASLLAKDGELVYSTCTVNPMENEGVVQSFLESHPEFSLVPITHSEMSQEALALFETGMGTVYPTPEGGDGFFIAKLKRNAT
ncbi:MAG: 16S rRNA (cytosine(967)-C(5))-methyltransferase RsmB [Ruminococcaceae bacterium]|nr:16S rRNA (cytosine(967)-C(5))-methyltransferase RsmB [Oscillospiraceae bacterium]